MTRRIGVLLLLGALLAMSPMLRPEAVSAAAGVDDYPSRLKNAAQDSLVDPWQFYNRECTSWVAWRLNSENNVAFNDYFEGAHWGNASNWKNAANSLDIPVDNNPTRGAVAWWAAGSAGSSRGHVAWVQTVGDGAITIEEYNYLHGGGYDTRTISSTSSMWPSGFIHIRDTLVRNTASPAVTGTPQVGHKLVTSNGSWTQRHLTFHYQWLANGNPIAGATTKAFKPSAKQVGKHLRAKVTATKSGAHSGTARSAPTDTIAKGILTLGALPTISGKPQVGVPLSATTGTWTPTPSYDFRWFAGHHVITGATGSTFAPTAAELNKPITVKVTASEDGYVTHTAASVASAAVAPGQFVAKTPPTISGTAQVDQPLTASPGSWTPAGTATYQWLVDGTVIDGATRARYTPIAFDLRRQISVRVTLSQVGYDDSVATSAASQPVAPGTFLNTRAPSVSGTAQVGTELRADPGAWKPRATITYQWLVGGDEVPDATSATFTPRPGDLGKAVVVEVTANRPGYLTAVLPASASGAVRPGVIRSTEAPAITGRAVIGHVLHSTPGTWSLDTAEVAYQWYAGHQPITGATGPTYAPTAAVAGHRIHVVATAGSPGYTSESATSKTTSRVVFGHTTTSKPTVTGHAVVGKTLTAHVVAFTPSSATAHYRWFRGDQPLHGAREAAYVVRPGDVRHHLHVEVTMRAENWRSVTKRSAAVRHIQTVPTLEVQTSVRHGRVFFEVTVHAPGLKAPNGRVRVLLGTRGLGRFDVTHGHGSTLLKQMASGRHRLTVIYHGGTRQVSVQTKVPVTAP